MDRLDAPAEDGLSRVLREVDFHSVVYCLSDFAAPWGFSVEPSQAAKFHLILDGAAHLTVGKAAPLQLAISDLVLLPHGYGHTITDQPGWPVRQLEAILVDNMVDETSRLRYGGDGRHTRLRPVDYNQEHAGDRSSDRLRERGLVFQGIQSAVRAAAGRVPASATGSSATGTSLALPRGRCDSTARAWRRR